MLVMTVLGPAFAACGATGAANGAGTSRSDEGGATGELDATAATDGGADVHAGGEDRERIRALDRGVYTFCDVRADDRVECRRLPFGNYDGGGYPAPFLTRVEALGMGFYAHAALHQDGTISRWTETDVGIGEARLVDGVAAAVAVSSSCYLTAARAVRCFDPANEPAGGLTDVVAIAAGQSFSCAITGSREVRCWGAGYRGQLGNGDTADSTTPVMVAGLSDVESISSWNAFSCAVLRDRRAACWGDNAHGSLGDGSTVAFSSTPVGVRGLDNVRAISTGYHHACALLMNGRVKCWGENDNGQLGNGGSVDSPTPVDVVDVEDAMLVSAGLARSCVVTSTGATKCWPAR